MKKKRMVMVIVFAGATALSACSMPAGVSRADVGSIRAAEAPEGSQNLGQAYRSAPYMIGTWR